MSDRSDYECECTCARCGAESVWQQCTEWDCQDGVIVGSDDSDEDQSVRVQPCDICGGAGGWYCCTSSATWCIENPMTGREATPRGEVEMNITDRRQT